MGSVGGKDQAKLIGMGASADSKPPSLAGVEKFIRAKVAAEAAKNKQKAAANMSAKSKNQDDGDDDSENLDLGDPIKEDDDPMD